MLNKPVIGLEWGAIESVHCLCINIIGQNWPHRTGCGTHLFTEPYLVHSGMQMILKLAPYSSFHLTYRELPNGLLWEVDTLTGVGLFITLLLLFIFHSQLISVLSIFKFLFPICTMINKALLDVNGSTGGGLVGPTIDVLPFSYVCMEKCTSMPRC